MRGSLFHVFLVAVGLMLVLPVMTDVPSSPSERTQALADILAVIDPVLGLGLLLTAVGLAVVMMFGGRGTGGL